MTTNDSENNSKPAPEAEKPKSKAKRSKAGKKTHRIKKSAGSPKPDRANKKAEVVAMMQRAKGTTLAEIMQTTGWQAHTVRGFISILGSKGGHKVDS